MKANHNMTRKQSNKITAIIFAASVFFAAVLIGVGMTMSPAPAHAKTSSDYDIMDLIASAQGTKIEQISPEIPKTLEEKALADEMNNLATANERAKAEKLINSQISYAL